MTDETETTIDPELQDVLNQIAETSQQNLDLLDTRNWRAAGMPIEALIMQTQIMTMVELFCERDPLRVAKFDLFIEKRLKALLESFPPIDTGIVVPDIALPDNVINLSERTK